MVSLLYFQAGIIVINSAMLLQLTTLTAASIQLCVLRECVMCVCE